MGPPGPSMGPPRGPMGPGPMGPRGYIGKLPINRLNGGDMLIGRIELPVNPRPGVEINVSLGSLLAAWLGGWLTAGLVSWHSAGWLGALWNGHAGAGNLF